VTEGGPHPALLDDPAHRAAWDPSGFWGRIASLPEQVVAARQAAGEVVIPGAARACARILVAGMGGSAIGGDLVAGLADALGGPQVVVWRDFGLPPWVDRQTLVVVSTYSGETPETLSSLDAALRRGVPLLVLTSGGTAARRAAQHALPLLSIPYRGEPRTAVGWLFFGLLALLERAGLFSVGAGWEEAIALLRRQGEALAPTTPLARNPAKELAAHLYGKIPVIWGMGFLKGVAHRWKTQVNENAKAPAFTEAVPEALHNAVEGLEGEATSPLGVVVLSSPLVAGEQRRQGEALRSLLQGKGTWSRWVEGEGHTPLGQVAGLLFLGDWTSYYLALLYRRDPAPVPTITALRAALQRGASPPPSPGPAPSGGPWSGPPGPPG
jgi:glucose/mannose-6-phosphate isomerase